jgi:hypothetical protein
LSVATLLHSSKAQPRPRDGSATVASRRIGMRTSGLVLLGYLCLSLLIYGRPVLGDPSHMVVGFGQTPSFAGRDQSAYVWFLGWGAHALAHGQNPFLTTAVYAPFGYNLAWAASILGPALLVAPVTLLFGAVVAFNVLAVAAPATAAWTTYLLCRALTRRLSSAVAGGLIVGFGTYETAEMVNHLNLALVALLPLCALIALRRHRRVTSRRRFICELGVVLGLQVWISTEVFASLIVFGAAALAIGVGLSGRAYWRQGRTLIGESAGALALAIAVGAPYFYYALAYPNPLSGNSAIGAGADLANFVIPSRVTWLHGHGRIAAAAQHLGGNLTEQLAYMGPALLVVVILFTFRFRRELIGRCVGVFALVTLVCSLGGRLVIDGHDLHVKMPWAFIGELPLIGHALPVRFVIYVWIAAAVALAVWLDQKRLRVWRWIAFGVIAISLAPNVTGVPWGTRIDSPPLVNNGTLAGYVAPGSTVLALPFGSEGNSMYWQMEAGFSFRLAGGYVSWAVPSQYSGLSIIHELTGQRPGGDEPRRLCAFIALTHADVILLREGTPGYWGLTLAPLHIRPQRSGGFAIYPLAGLRMAGRTCHA